MRGLLLVLLLTSITEPPAQEQIGAEQASTPPRPSAGAALARAGAPGAIPPPLSILEEALQHARATKDPWVRAGSLVELAVTLERLDRQKAVAVMNEAWAVVEKLPEGPSVWLETFKDGWLTGPLLRKKRARARGFLEAKSELALELVRLHAQSDPSRALERALSLSGSSWRASGVEVSLGAFPDGKGEEAVAAVRSIAAGSGTREPDIATLAALASVAEKHDASLAREIAHRAVRSVGDHTYVWAAQRVYAVLARLDREASQRVVLELKSIAPKKAQKRLEGFAKAASEVQPDLAWRALRAMDIRDEDVRSTAAEVLRQMVTSLPPEITDDAGAFAFALVASLPDHNPVWGTDGNVLKEFRKLSVACDAVVGAAALDPDRAVSHAEKLRFSLGIGFRFLDKRTFLAKEGNAAADVIPSGKKDREELWESFFRDLVRLDLALSLPPARLEKSLSILDSLDEPFWSALAYVALRGRVSGMGRASNAEGVHIQSRVTRILMEVRTGWPRMAAAVRDSQPSVARRALDRFRIVAQQLDLEAARMTREKDGELKRYGEKIEAASRGEYLPLSLTIAGSALQGVDATSAVGAFRKGLQVAMEMPSPARELALASHAAAWIQASPELGAEAGREASRLSGALREDMEWDDFLPRLVYELARFDPHTAYQMARTRGGPNVRPSALIGVAKGMREGEPPAVPPQ